MNHLISLGIGLFVGVLYGALALRSPAPPAIALVRLIALLLRATLSPIGRPLVSGWLS